MHSKTRGLKAGQLDYILETLISSTQCGFVEVKNTFVTVLKNSKFTKANLNNRNSKLVFME